MDKVDFEKIFENFYSMLMNVLNGTAKNENLFDTVILEFFGEV